MNDKLENFSNELLLEEFENTIAKIWQNVKTPKLLEEKSIKLREELLRRLQQIK